MEWLKEAMEFIANLKEESRKANISEHLGNYYTDKSLELMEPPMAEPIILRTLTGLVDYLKSGIDYETSEIPLIVHVVGPRTVKVYSPLRRSERTRECFVTVEAQVPDTAKYGQWMDMEPFNIMMQSAFVPNGDKEILLKVSGNVEDKTVKTVGDDGVTQAISMKTGVGNVDYVKVPNPVTLAPYRTFTEVPQPESQFIFRMRTGPQAALFEADGGAWKNTAMQYIKAFLQTELSMCENIKVIA